MIGLKLEKRYEWMFSDKHFEDGTIDVHFVFDTFTGKVSKVIEKRTEYKTNSKEELLKEN